jgi:hypothetical protein
MSEPAPERIPPDDTTGSLRERLIARLESEPLFGAGETVDVVLDELAGDPGDLPARMTAEMRRHSSTVLPGECICGARVDGWDEHLATAALSVRWEHAASQAAEVERLRALTATCTCYDGNPENYEGAHADCPVHGAVRAYNDAQAEVERLRAELAEAKRQFSTFRNEVLGDLSDVVKERGEAQAERDALKAKVTEYENALNWQVSCLGCSKLLTSSINDQAQIDLLAEERDALKATIERVKAIAERWGRGLWAERYAARELQAALDAPETTGDAETIIEGEPQ